MITHLDANRFPLIDVLAGLAHVHFFPFLFVCIILSFYERQHCSVAFWVCFFYLLTSPAFVSAVDGVSPFTLETSTCRHRRCYRRYRRRRYAYVHRSRHVITNSARKSRSNRNCAACKNTTVWRRAKLYDQRVRHACLRHSVAGYVHAKTSANRQV